VKVVLVLVGRSFSRCPQKGEIVFLGGRCRWVAIDNFIIPKIGLVGPRSQPELLVQQTAQFIWKRVAFDINARTNDFTLVDVR
jgi:hypothetical protein